MHVIVHMRGERPEQIEVSGVEHAARVVQRWQAAEGISAHDVARRHGEVISGSGQVLVRIAYSGRVVQV